MIGFFDTWWEVKMEEFSDFGNLFSHLQGNPPLKKIIIKNE